MDTTTRYTSSWRAYSSTSAYEELTISNNGTWSDAFIFGKQDDTTWTFDNVNFELDVQRNRFDTVPLLSLTTGNGRIVIDDTAQRVLHFNVTPADIQASLSPGVYVYDLVMVDGSNTRVLLMHGPLEVVQGVTYPP